MPLTIALLSLPNRVCDIQGLAKGTVPTFFLPHAYTLVASFSADRFVLIQWERCANNKY